MNISVLEPIGDAFERTIHILFVRFDLKNGFCDHRPVLRAWPLCDGTWGPASGTARFGTTALAGIRVFRVNGSASRATWRVGDGGMIDRFVLIIGSMKSGTTTLFEHLAQHPSIAPCSIKEPHFFSNDDRWAKGWAWYESLWDFCPAEHARALEASANYTKVPLFPSTVERIASIKADYRFIYLMRHPVQRIESHYRWFILHGAQQPIPPIDRAVTPHMIAVSKYAMQLDEYTKRFPRQHILLLALEDLKRNPQLLLERVCRFLEIDPEFKFEGLSVMRNPSLVDHPLYTLLGKVPLLPTVVKKVMPTRHRRALRNRLGRKLEVETKVSDAQRDRIMTELREDMRRLRDEYGFDVSRWDLACPPGTDPGRMLGSCGFWI